MGREQETRKVSGCLGMNVNAETTSSHCESWSSLPFSLASCCDQRSELSSLENLSFWVFESECFECSKIAEIGYCSLPLCKFLKCNSVLKFRVSVLANSLYRLIHTWISSPLAVYMTFVAVKIL